MRDGWPEPIPGCTVTVRETGITLGSLLLDDAEWRSIERAPVFSIRIDDHPETDGWTTNHPDGTQTAKSLRASYLDLEKRRALVQIDGPQPDIESPGDLTLLDALPFLHVHLQDSPEELQRALYIATRLAVRVQPGDPTVVISVTLDDRTTSALNDLDPRKPTPHTARLTTNPRTEPEPGTLSNVSMQYVPPDGLEPTLRPF